VPLVVEAFGGELGFKLPIVELTYQVQSRGIGCPVSVDPASIGKAVKAKVMVTLGKVCQTPIASEALPQSGSPF